MADDVFTVPAPVPAPVDDGAAEMIRGAVVTHPWYPVYLSDSNAHTVLAWLRGR